MQVSGVELPQQQTAEANAAQPQQAAGGIFAAFLKGAIGNTYAPLRLEAGTGIGQKITAEESTVPADDHADANTLGERADAVDTGDTNGGTTSDRQDSAENTDTKQADTEGAKAAPDVGEILEATQSDQFAQIALVATVSQKGKAGQTAPSNGPQTAVPIQATGPQGAPNENLLNAAREAANGQSKGQNRLTAQVSETPQQLVSRPTTTLAASVAVAAQADRQRGDGTPASNTVDKASDNSGNLLLNDSANKADRSRNALRAGMPSATAALQSKAGDAGHNPTPQAATFSNLLAQNQTAATANRAAPGAVRGPELMPQSPATSLASGPAATNSVARPPAPAVPPQVPPRALTGQIAVQIQKSVAQGVDHIKIQLKPAELGRVEIKLDVMQDGRVAATIVADRPETLELLQRDTRGLQQALQDAGLKSNSADLSFNLGGGNASADQHAAASGNSGSGQDDEGGEAAADAGSENTRRRASTGVIDVEV